MQDMNLIYDIAAPVLPSLMFYGIERHRNKSFQESQNSDKIEA